ncbi:DUF1134 domain-containing protein [Lichenibacterium minor]|jgi:hypothetical protein|uniref:DUF1134 domain-containing protein n=1 Tax=Lichenibacterium minor TaxID=2316528 RepID=A0A4Q2U9E1_9HYPH|nr:DUF1134 domain-containing protein [Lichenibacterium minor]RYC33413.1 DUF1134 domain-containing protein [Lichenibacterium minor]
MVEWSRRSVLAGLAGAAGPALWGGARAQGAPERFSTDDIVDKGHHFFGSVSRGIALTVEEAARRFGQPNGYVLGQEAGGAFIGGLRYGEGLMYTRNAGDQKVYWEGPSIGFDAGANGDRTMMLVYGLPSTQAIFQRFGGLDGSAYVIGGFGFTALTNERVVVVPIRSGVGARLGVALSYLKFTPRPTWNPF